MQSESVPDRLVDLREQIDAIDEEIVMTLARRFAVTREVGRIKAENGLDSVDPVREQEKLDRLAALAGQQSLDREFVSELFQRIFREVVKNHRSFLKG